MDHRVQSMALDQATSIQAHSHSTENQEQLMKAERRLKKISRSINALGKMRMSAKEREDVLQALKLQKEKWQKIYDTLAPQPQSIEETQLAPQLSFEVAITSNF